MLEVTNSVLHAVTSVLQIPVIIILFLFVAATIVSIGWILSEFFQEHRHMKVQLPKLLDEIRSEEKEITVLIEESGLLKSQKTAVLELTRHKNFTPLMRESLMESLLEDEQNVYSRKIKVTDLLSKLGPMLGLMGTLVPLGPGIIALGQGDTYTLSQSLQTAFDTTIAGLCVAAAAIVISSVRKNWYSKYMSDLETVMDCVLEMEKEHGEKEKEQEEK